VYVVFAVVWYDERCCYSAVVAFVLIPAPLALPCEFVVSLVPYW